jgi:ATP-dependent Clp protease ATP-binding subunit ClpA
MNEEMMESIVKIQLKAVEKRLEKNGYRFNYTDALEKHLLADGFDKVYGARPLKRVINEQILDEIATEIIEEKIHPKDLIAVDYKNKKVIISSNRVN